MKRNLRVMSAMAVIAALITAGSCTKGPSVETSGGSPAEESRASRGTFRAGNPEAVALEALRESPAEKKVAPDGPSVHQRTGTYLSKPLRTWNWRAVRVLVLQQSTKERVLNRAHNFSTKPRPSNYMEPPPLSLPTEHWR